MLLDAACVVVAVPVVVFVVGVLELLELLNSCVFDFDLCMTQISLSPHIVEFIVLLYKCW